MFSPAAAAVYAQRAQFAAVTFDHVRIVLTRPPNEVVLDTIVTFDPTSPPKTLELTVDVRVSGEIFDGLMEYTNNGVAVYRGTVKVQSHAPDEPAPAGPTLVLAYVGPGANATRLVIAPKTVTLVAPATASFSATAFDASNTAIPNPPVAWTSSDPSVLTIDANTGAAATTGKRGSVTVTGRMPTNISDNGTVSVSLPASTITLVSGGGQTGKVGGALTQPAVVQVSASDGVGVAGVTVNFAAPAGGSVGSPSATTDANGRASTSLTLGSAVGPQSFAASAAGFSVSIGATATAGDPAAVLAISGSGQVDTVRKALKAPFVVKVTDRFGNAVGGVTVSWTRTAGSGALSGSSSVTGADGQASIGYTLGATVGAETVTASVAGVTAGASFTATALSAAPAAIVVVSGNAQTARIGQAVTLSVKVTDEAGNPVAAVPVNWTATNGTIPAQTVTDAQGVSANTLTLGTTVGAASATATVGSGAAAKSVTFNATVQTGTVARLVFRSVPPTGVAGRALTPAIQIELRDAGNNLTPAANPVTIALGANAAGAVLGGTLGRTSVAGVATFDDLTIDKAGTGFTLVASSAGVPSVTSAAFDVTGAPVGPAATLTFVDGSTFQPLSSAPSYTVVAGGSITNPAAVKVTDSTGAAVANAPVTVTVLVGGESVAFTGTAQSNAQGIVTFASLGVPAPVLQTANTYVVRLSTGTVTPISFTVTVTAGPAAALKFASRTAATANAGAVLSPSPVVVVTDAYNNQVPSAADVITVALTPGTGTAGAVLSGTTTVTASGGTAVFSNLTIDRVGNGYTLTATAANRTSDVSAAINVSSGVGSQYVLTAPTTTPTTGSQTTVTAQFADQFGNPVATPTPRSVGWSVSGAGSLNGQSSATNAAGQATIVYIAPATTGTNGVVTATDATTSNISGQITFTPAAGAQAKLGITTAPPLTAQNAAQLGTIVVQVQDASGAAVALPGLTVSASLSAFPQGGLLVGQTLTATTNASGQATFTTLSLRGQIGNYTVQFNAGSLTPASLTFTMTPGAPAKAAWIQQPPTPAVAGVPFDVRLGLYDLDDNLATNAAASQVTVTIQTNSGTSGAVLSGTTTLNTSGGVAVFAGISINLSGSAYRLSAATVVGPVASNAFDVVPAPTALAIVSMPQQFTNGALWSPPAAVRLVNGSTNVPLAGVTVTVAFTEEEGEGEARPPTAAIARNRRLRSQSRSRAAPPVVEGATAITDANGVATFTNLKYTGQLAFLSMEFTATGSGFGPLTLQTFGPSMLAGPPVALEILDGQNQIGIVNAPLSSQLYVYMVDVSGNFVVSPAASIAFTPAAGSGTANPATRTTDAEGIAFTEWTMPAAPGPVTLVASATLSGGLASVTFNATAVAAIPASVTAVTGPGLVTTVGTPMPGTSYPRVSAKDASNQPMPNVDVDFSTSSGCSISGGTVRVQTDANGEAALTPAQLPFPATVATSCHVNASVPGYGGVVFSMIAAPPGVMTWTGGGTGGPQVAGQWTSVSSWSPAGSPSSTTAVYIPSNPVLNAALNINATIGSLTTESTATQVLNLFSSNLTVLGNVTSSQNAGVFSTSSGRLVMAGSGPSVLSGFVNAQITIGPAGSCLGTYSLSGTLVQTFSAILNCPLNIGTTVYNIAGSLNVSGAQARVEMTQAAAGLVTSSDATFASSAQAGFLTAGTMSIGGTLNVNTAPFSTGPNHTLVMPGGGTRAFNIGTNTVSLGNFVAGANTTVPITAGSPLTVTGTFTVLGNMSVSSGTTVNVGGAASFATGSTSSILGAMTVTGSSLFSSGSSVTGSGTMTVAPATCTRSAAATVNVTGTPGFTAAVPTQCANQIP